MKDTSDYAIRARKRGRPIIEIPMPDWPSTVAEDDPRLADRTFTSRDYGAGNWTKWTPDERWALEMRAYLTTRVGRYWRGIDCDHTIGPPIPPGVRCYCLKRGDRRVTDGLFAQGFLTVPPVAWALRVERTPLRRLLMVEPSWSMVYTRYIAPMKSMEVRYPWLDGMKMLDLAAALSARGVKCNPRLTKPRELYRIARSVALMRLRKSDEVRMRTGGKDRRKAS